jgi:Pyridoxamine 5'-phosphate oxidase
MSLTMTKEEREAFLADVHVGVISVAEDGHGPLTVPVWYSYEPEGEVRIITARRSRKGKRLERAGRFSLCAQTETPPYKYVSVEGPIVAIEVAPSRAVISAPSGATGTSKARATSSGTCLFVCGRSDDLRSTTQSNISHGECETG